MSAHLRLIMVVQTPEIARLVAAGGVETLFVDLEHIGKEARQGHVPSWKSRQTMADVSLIREAVPGARLLVRVNPPGEHTRGEVDEVIARGADAVMLPMFRTREELLHFADLVAGRAECLPLFETAAAVELLPELAGEGWLTDLHIGLNDLHLDLGMRFLFEPLADGTLEEPCAALREAGVRFGIGGVARAGEGIVPPELLLGEHVRLGSTGAILSQTFHRNAASGEELEQGFDFAAEVARLRTIYAEFAAASPAQLQANRKLVSERVGDVVVSLDRRRVEGSGR